MKIDAFDVTAFHYLIKPIEEEKFGLIFERAVLEVQKIRRRIEEKIYQKQKE